VADTIQRAESRTRPLSIIDLGLIAYSDCWELQKRLASERAEGAIGDTLLLLEHPHTYTCGRRGGREHILISEHELDAHGIEVLDVDRGGDVTYHGPGQLVAYPIVRLADEGHVADYHAYLRTLEQVLIDTLAHFAISAFRVGDYTGVWVRAGESEEKIAAVGVKVDGRGVSSHGVALNVNTNLDYFSYIVPCGIAERGVTSMQRLLGTPLPMSDVKAAFVAAFCAGFNFTPAQR
jgi:lipoate-protein ligase B